MAEEEKFRYFCLCEVGGGDGGLEFGAKNMLADGFGFICEAKSISSQCH